MGFSPQEPVYVVEEETLLPEGGFRKAANAGKAVYKLAPDLNSPYANWITAKPLGFFEKLGKRLSSKAAEGVSEGTHLVYQGFDKAGAVKYIGITGRDASVRFGEHLSSGTARSLLRYEVVPGATNLSKTGARILEQNLINQHGLNNLLNVRNSIAPKKWGQYGIK